MNIIDQTVQEEDDEDESDSSEEEKKEEEEKEEKELDWDDMLKDKGDKGEGELNASRASLANSTQSMINTQNDILMNL